MAQPLLCATPRFAVKLTVLEPPTNRLAEVAPRSGPPPHSDRTQSKQVTEGPKVVSCTCSSHPAASSVRNSAKKWKDNKDKVEVSCQKKYSWLTNIENNEQDKVKAEKVTSRKIQITAHKAEQKTLKKPDELGRDILAFPETCKILLSKKTNYMVSAYIGSRSSRMDPFAYVFHPAADANFFRADVLDKGWLRSIWQRDM